jgi:hypothetical protein
MCVYLFTVGICYCLNCWWVFAVWSSVQNLSWLPIQLLICFTQFKSSDHTLRNFRILTQFSWRFWSLLTCLQPTPSPFFSSIHALVFLVRILVIGCRLYLGVLGLYSSRWFGFFPSFLKKQNLHSPPFFLQVSSQP